MNYTIRAISSIFICISLSNFLYQNSYLISKQPVKLTTCGGTGQWWSVAGTGALGAADLGMAYVLLEEVAVNPTIELPELTQDWETDFWRAQ